MNGEVRLGATALGDGRCRFVVWAPRAQGVEVRLVHPRDRGVAMKRMDHGYHEALIDDVEPGTRYLFRLDGSTERPDPASRFQPDGVHGPSQVTDPRAFAWEDDGWGGRALPEYVLYELHVGTFTPEGACDAVIAHLDALKDLGITAIELMPVAQFPGTRNWGYDGVFPFAVQNSYGGPEALKRLVNACHARGLCVVLDVVYNHLGPEGNYLAEFGPYFTDRYRTPWGLAVNFDGPWSDEVRRFFIENALSWITEFHLDALRLDALHAVFDFSAEPFLRELSAAVESAARRLNRKVHLIGESDLNDSRLIRPRERGGYGLNAQWNDDFHHALHALLTGEQSGYYQDFGRIEHLVKAFTDGYVYTGQPSVYRRRRHGNDSRDCEAYRLVVCSQNHDQVGNRLLGERLSRLVGFESLKLAAGVVLLSPFLPLLFMGEEYGEAAPFLYFVSHSDPSLIEAVRRGRREEFAAFAWQGEAPDPQDDETFVRSKLNRALRTEGPHRILEGFYQELLRLRRTLPALSHLDNNTMEVVGYERERVVFVRRWSTGSDIISVFHLGDEAVSIALPIPNGRWVKALDSAEERWQGGGSPVPDSLTSSGSLTLGLPPWACVLFAKSPS